MMSRDTSEIDVVQGSGKRWVVICSEHGDVTSWPFAPSDDTSHSYAESEHEALLVAQHHVYSMHPRKFVINSRLALPCDCDACLVLHDGVGPRHHGDSARRNWGCRCPKCRAR